MEKSLPAAESSESGWGRLIFFDFVPVRSREADDPEGSEESAESSISQSGVKKGKAWIGGRPEDLAGSCRISHVERNL